MPEVFHFVRRYLHYTATFIGNQVSKHKKYESSVFYREFIPHASFTFPNVFCIDKSRGFKHRMSNFIYRFFRQITPSQEKYILKQIEKKQPSVLHFHYGTDAGMFHNIIKKSGVPSLVSFYGWDYSYFPKRFFGIGKKYLQKRVFDHCDIVLAMSMNMKKELISLGCNGEKIRIHYHGIDTKLFDIDRDYSAKEEINIYLLSSLEPKKGHMFLLKAFKKSTEISDIPIRLHFTGKYGKFKNIKKVIKKMGLEKQVIWHAPYEYGGDRHIRMLSKADIFIHPSVTDKNGNKEGIPGTLMEAMSSGLATISTYHAGIPEIIIDGKTGFLVQEWDEDALSQKILLLANNPELRKTLGQKAKEYAVENLDIDKKQAELEQIYDDLTESKEKSKS